jgi:methylase of polypeptide subunit release factors
MSDFNIASAVTFLSKAKLLIDEKSKESVLRHNLSASLPQMFPSLPWWIGEHVTGAEANAIFHKAGLRRQGFVDALVGSTVIEYEKNINDPRIFAEGLNQVADYCANLLNKGVSQDLITGVLSDTLRWKAYRISEIKILSSVSGAVIYGKEHLSLEEIDGCDLSGAGISEANLLGAFLERHLGRVGARRLSALTLSKDLGFESTFSKPHLLAIGELVNSAFASNINYAGLIEKLWGDFVSYLGAESSNPGFDRSTYTSELYILTLAKLICANILVGKALASSDAEIIEILDGAFFQNRGLSNLVEYDYFGWLNSPPYVRQLLPVAKAIQSDLIAYDFASMPVEDLFGVLMAQLASRSQRLMLGQEWTPLWLADELVGKTLSMIPDDEEPRLIDMCCGSGAMVVQAVKHAKERLLSQGVKVGSTEALIRLSEAITGFDIDPLAVILAKISWVLAAREWLNISQSVSIPVYHADSLFAATPLTKSIDDEGITHHHMLLDDKEVDLPAFLVSPEKRALFDLLLDRGYAVAMASAKSHCSEVNAALIEGLVSDAIKTSDCYVEANEIRLLNLFASELILSLEELQRSGRNGIWAFVLRNTYRPGLVMGKFNGLVSNPPWLALSKIADNPYKEALRSKADSYGIKPPGPAHLHVEMATIFLLHAVEKYLVANSAIGCILPESVMSAYHHNPFRAAAYSLAKRPVDLRVDEIWKVEIGTFKNEAIVFFGTKASATGGDIKGCELSRNSNKPVTFKRIVRGSRSAWSDTAVVGATATGFFRPADFRQGADVMPRTFVFHALQNLSGIWNASPITPVSNFRYLIADAKTYKNFSITANGLSDKLVFDILLSHHLSPFSIGHGAKGILPIQKLPNSQWSPIPLANIAAISSVSASVISNILSALGPGTSTQSYFERIETDRKKLSNQSWSSGWLIFMGAGGSNVCAAYAPASLYPDDKTIIDQTLYWAKVDTEDEAVYLTGLLNSDAINSVIREFQPRGQFGERHIHKLPLGVTPPFSASNPAHADLVSKTKQLMLEWTGFCKNNQTITKNLLDPNISKLHIRRKRIKDIFKTLPSWEDYETACKGIYCIT